MRRQILTCTGTAVLLAMAAGCATSSKAPHATPPESADATAMPGLPPELKVTPAFRPIVRAALAQADHPIAGSKALPPPEALPTELATPIAGDSPEAERASMPLDATLAALAARPSVPAPSAVPPDAALRAYLRGREKLLAGNHAGAIDDLRTATELDPTAGEPWRELGEAQLATGQQTQARSSFQNAVDRGVEEPRILELLGRASLDRGETAEAAGYLARALAAGPERIDPLLPPVIQVQLAKALAQEGYLRAARQAIDAAFAGRRQISSGTRYSSEFGAIFRRQGEIWREAGDISLRLGDYGDALEAYARCATLPVMDGISITPRLVYAASRAGRPAAAAIFLLEGIAARGGRTVPEDAAMLRHLAQARGFGPALGDAIGRYRADLTAEHEGLLPPTLSRSLTNLQAAVVAPNLRRDLLRSHLRTDPTDIPGILALLDSSNDISGAAAEASHLAAVDPHAAPFIAEALFRSRHAVPLELLTKSNARGGILVAAYIATGQGDPGHGLELLDLIAASAPEPAIELARVQMAIAAARPILAKPAIDRLATLESTDGRRAHARALLLLQRPGEARERVQLVLEDKSLAASQRSADLLLAAEIAGQLASYDEAELLLVEARKLDPLDERPLNLLLELYSTLRPDQSRFNELVRDLRMNHEDGRAIRTLRAREFLRRSMPAAAEREVLALLEADPSDFSSLRLLLSIWDELFRAENSAVDRARDWVDARLDRRGFAPAYMMAMAAVEIGAGSPQMAEPRLREAVEKTGHPDLSRLLEKLLREHLDRGAEADQLALARLENRERTPAEAMELAQLYHHRQRTLDAVNIAREALESADTIPADQAILLLDLAAALGRQSVDANQAESQEVAAWLFDALVERRITLRPDDHEVRLVLTARGRSVADCLAAAKLTLQQYPQIGQGAYIRGMRALFTADRPEDAVRFAATAATEIGSPTQEFLFDYFRVLTQAGTAEDIRSFIETAEPGSALKSLLERITGAPIAGNIRAEAAYLLGNFNSSNGRRETADAAYELALEYDPNHPWACNNLGYSLADRNVDLERAAELLERAHAALPAEAAITDSLGWLRYKQGLLDDEQRPDGTTRKGAVSLLQEAASTEHGSQDPTILDHYGDALWLAGRAAEAAHHWQLAQNYSSRMLRPATGAPEAISPTDAAAAEYRDIIARATAKRQLMGSGQWVPVAPQARNARPTPPPTAAPPTGVPDPAAKPEVGATGARPASAG